MKRVGELRKTEINRWRKSPGWIECGNAPTKFRHLDLEASFRVLHAPQEVIDAELTVTLPQASRPASVRHDVEELGFQGGVRGTRRCSGGHESRHLAQRAESKKEGARREIRNSMISTYQIIILYDINEYHL